MIIKREIIEELINQAQQDAPNETCGYLLGVSSEDGEVVTENYWRTSITRPNILPLLQRISSQH